MSRLLQYLGTISAFSAPKVVDYPWDEYTYTDYFYHETPEMLDEFGKLTGLGNRALCIAVAEWITFRLKAAQNVRLAQDYLDAAWITMIHRDSCEYAELSQGDWPGPLDGVLRAAMLIVNDSIFDAEQDLLFAERSCWIVNLARFICSDDDQDQFESWLEKSLARLADYHSGPTYSSGSIFDRNFSFGSPVGPGLFILSLTYEPDSATNEIREIVNSQIGQNRYLRIAKPL